MVAGNGGGEERVGAAVSARGGCAGHWKGGVGDEAGLPQRAAVVCWYAGERTKGEDVCDGSLRPNPVAQMQHVLREGRNEERNDPSR